MDLTADKPDTLIIVAQDLASFYDFLKPRQGAGAQAIVVLLDRRRGERRTAVRPVGSDRRSGERRSRPSEAARALMSVLGFTILHREGERYSA
ncbi:MAG: hypothetical protein HY002_03330 [Candidatus Rokubacteria bacterium]|nr:hypothetical protein [Candidatus Rokubacteria bacterium]